ncbi:unnamed protein product, partial [Brassica oleracea]
LSKSLLLCRAEAKEQFLGFMISKTKLFSLRFDVHEEFTVKEILDSFNQVEISEVLVCDGLLLCVTVTRDEYSQRPMPWNPYLGQTRWIQTRRSYDRSDVYALGYDKSTNRNHKILMYCYGYKEDECEIYDVKSDSWRTLDVKLHWGWGEEYFHVSASLQGNAYFLDRDGHDEMFTGTNLSVFKRDIHELIGEFVEGDLTSFADMKRVWLSRKFSYVYEALPSSNLVFFIESLLAHAIVEANDKGVEIATAVVKLMLDRKVFIFGAVDFDEACTTRGESRQSKQWVHYWS